MSEVVPRSITRVSREKVRKNFVGYLNERAERIDLVSMKNKGEIFHIYRFLLWLMVERTRRYFVRVYISGRFLHKRAYGTQVYCRIANGRVYGGERTTRHCLSSVFSLSSFFILFPRIVLHFCSSSVE